MQVKIGRGDRSAGRGQGGCNLDRVMPIVLDEGELAAAVGCRHRQFPITLEPPPDALEFRQRFFYSFVRHVQLHGDSDGRQGIQHVMVTGKIEHHIHVRQGDAVAALHSEVHLRADRADIHSTHLGIFGHAVAGDGALHIGPDFPHSRIVHAKDGRSIKRHAMQELQKRALEPVEIVAVGLHVVRIDIRHHRHHRYWCSHQWLHRFRLWFYSHHQHHHRYYPQRHHRHKHRSRGRDTAD